jgi:phenylacetate-coenzyme A ligase PaaK-like adenylate-forming protein
MKIDFANFNIQDDCFNKENIGLRFLDKDHSEFFSKVCEVMLLETASRRATEIWQICQLNHLLKHAVEKSPFWRDRLSTTNLNSLEDLSKIPIQTREDVKTQVSQDGCLLPAEEGIYTHHTSGSSGIPIKFHYARANEMLNHYRMFARYILGNFDLTDSTTRLFASSYIDPPGFLIDYGEGAGKHGFLTTGPRRVIAYSNPELREFRKAISSEKIGYLIVNPYMMDTLRTQIYPIEDMVKDGLTAWTPIGGSGSEEAKKECKEHGVRITGNYSSEEIGLIGYECNENPDHYHVSTSNVIVECIPEEDLKMGDSQLGRLLITKMSSHATPFIRYDIGDIGELLHKCPCGHDGPTIRNLHGRTKNLVRKADGSIWPFLVQIKNHTFISNYKEFRFIQTTYDTIRIQIGGINSISEEEVKLWSNVVYDQLGFDFKIEIELLDNIDWHGSKKKIPFKSLVI